MPAEAETRETVWVTRDVLSDGILERQVAAKIASDVYVRMWPTSLSAVGLVPGEFFRTREAALAQADRMRTAEITRLRARIAELEAMNF